MPSGPRKRRAAKRKKEMEEQMKATSASDPPLDAGRSEDRGAHEGGAADGQSPTFCSAPILSSKEGFGSDADDSAAESSKNLKDEDLVEEDEQESAPAVNEVAFRPEDESDAKSDEVAESEKENSKPAEESTIGLTERSQATEYAARVLEETSGDNTEKETQLPGADGIVNHDGDAHQVAGVDETSSATKEAAAENLLEGISGVDGEKESQLPDVDVAVKHGGDGRQAAVGDETLPATELLHRSPPVERRTKWWNCCGLLGFVTNLDG